MLASLLFLDLARPVTVVSLANLHKRPEALARYYVTSYWQAEWVTFPPPLPPTPLWCNPAFKNVIYMSVENTLKKRVLCNNEHR